MINLLKNLSRERKFYLETINLFIENDFIPLSSKKILKIMSKAIRRKNIF